MGDSNEIRPGRHCIFALHAHLVFVTKYRHRVFTTHHLERMEEIMRAVCVDFECELVEFNGESNHVQSTHGPCRPSRVSLHHRPEGRRTSLHFGSGPARRRARGACANCWKPGGPRRADEYGTTPLYRASVQGATEAVRLLLAHGADPDTPEPPHPQQTGPGTPPLLWAVRNGHRETVELLLAAGADPEIPGTPLTIAAQGGRYGIVRSLPAHGADPAGADPRGRTPLAIATRLASADPVALLAEQWAGPDREYSVHRRPAGDGTDVITLRYGDQGQGGETSIQDGHAAIARLLGGLGRGGCGKLRIPLSWCGIRNTSRAGSRVSAHSHYLFLVERIHRDDQPRTRVRNAVMFSRICSIRNSGSKSSR
jgi:REP element-mobilizing transposase RayT